MYVDVVVVDYMLPSLDFRNEPIVDQYIGRLQCTHKI